MSSSAPRDWDQIFATGIEPVEPEVSSKVSSTLDILDQMIDQYWEMFNSKEIRPLEKVRIGRILKETIDVRLKYSMDSKGDKQEKKTRDYSDVKEMLKKAGVQI